jgi:hypothetical protein
MPFWERIRLASGFCAVLVAWSVQARAEDPAEAAARHFERAIQHADAQEYDAALIEFRKAYELSPHYSVNYNIGLASVSAGRPLAAVQAFERYLAEGGTEIPEERRAHVTALIDGERAKLARLVIDLQPKEAEVSIDGALVNVTEAGLELDPGPHTLAVRAPGRVERSVSVNVRPGEVTKVVIALTDLPQRQLELRCELPDVSVELDGRAVAQTGDAAKPVTFAVPSDARALTLTRPGYGEQLVPLAGAGADRAIACRLAALPDSRTARLTLSRSDAGEAVWLDGLPFRGGAVAPGRHRVLVQRQGFVSSSRSVTLQAGRELWLDVELLPTPEYRAEYERRAWAQRRLAYGLGIGGLGVAAGALATVLYSNHLYGEWQDEQASLPPAGAPATPEEGIRQTENDEREDTVETLDRVALGLGVASTLLLGTAVFLYLDGDDPDRYRSSGRVGVGLRGSSLTLHAEF